MADLAASDLTYTELNKRNFASRKFRNYTIAFGDGALTYPTGGVPLTIGKLGCPNVIESLNVYDRDGSVYGFGYDRTNKKLRMFRGGSHSHDLLLKNAVVADGASDRVNAATNKLGANTGSDITVAGGGANGGVQAAFLNMVELVNTVAPAAQTIKVEVIGW